MERIVTPEETPLYEMAYKVGEANFVDLLIAKGMELDLLTEQQKQGGRLDSIVYSVKRGVH